jgi:hypothetical protein
MMFYVRNVAAREYARRIVEYGKKNFWQYHDRRPNVNGLWYAIKHPIKSYKYFKRLKEGDESAREDYPELDALSYIRQPRDICFYKLVSPDHNPNWFEKLYLALSILMTAVRDKEYKNGGTKLIAWYRMKVFQYYNADSGLVKMAHKYLIRKLRKQYGKKYVTELHKLYYKDRNHPIHVFAEVVDEIQN